MPNDNPNHGPSALLKRHQDEVEEILDLYQRLHLGDIDIADRIASVRKRTGITIGRIGSQVIATSGAVDVITNAESSGTLRQSEIEDLVRRARSVLGRDMDAPAVAALRGRDERGPDEGEIIPFRVAAAIDRHRGFLKRALPSLRPRARHVVLVDRLLLAHISAREGSTGRWQDDFRTTCHRSGYLRRGEMGAAVRLIGNIAMLKTDAIDRGRISVRMDIPDVVLATMTGKPLEQFVTGRGLEGSGLSILKAERKWAEEIVIETDAASEEMLVAVDVAGM